MKAKHYTVIISTLVLFVSCSGNGLKQKRSYYYEQTDIRGHVSYDTIKAETDSAAYVDAIEKFAISGAVDEKMRIEYPSMYSGQTKPLRFTLTNEMGEIIHRPNCISEDDEIKISKDCYDHVLKRSSGNSQNVTHISSTPDSVKIASLKKFFNYKEDEFSDKVWVTPKNAPKYVNVNGCYSYFQLNGDRASNMRLKLQYHGDNWLFFRLVQWNIDGWKYDFYPSDTKTDHNSDVWEWFDLSANETGVSEIITKLATCSSAKYRLVGDTRSKTVTLTAKQIEDFKRTLDLYYAYNGNL